MARTSSSTIQISRRGLFIWIGLIVFISFWMFILGVMVGRGLAPVNLETGKLEQELAELKSQTLQKKQETAASHTAGQTDEKSQLGFYEALKNPGKETAFRPAKPATSPAPKPAVKPLMRTQKPPPKASAPSVREPEPSTTKQAAPKAASNTNPEKASDTGYFAVQVASVQDLKGADKLVAELRDKGYHAYRVRSEVGGKGVWYRIRVGGFEDRNAAANMLKKLKDDKYGGMVVSTK
jgi:cell division septation protein DedD